jgi:hypothetical protein
MRIFTDADFDDYEVEEPIWCQMCLKRGYQVRLGPKLLMPGEVKPDDYGNFLECPTCWWLCPIYQIEQEATIKDAVETSDSPFEGGKFVLETIPKRSSAAGKRASAKKRKSKIKLDDDPEINDLLRTYGDRVNVLK